MRQYSCGWNTSNHKVTVMAVSEPQAKFKCKLSHGSYPDYAEQVEFSGYYVKAGALVLADAHRHEMQLGPSL